MRNARFLYLHGFASGPGSSKAQYFRNRLAETGVDLAIPDLAGGDFEHLTLSSQLRTIQHIECEGGLVLIGSSMGGYLAALHAARSSRVERLVLMAPAFGFARRWAESIGPAAQEEWRRSGYMEVYHYGEARNRRLGYGLMEDALQYEEYPDVRQPTLVFHGRADTVVPCRYAEEFAAGRPNVRLVLLDSGHELLDALEEIWTEARAFLVGG